MKRALVLISAAALGTCGAHAEYKVLSPVTQENLTVFPVAAATTHDGSIFLSLDEGLRTGEVIVEERGRTAMIRQRPGTRVVPPAPRAEVNRLVLVNKSSKPLLLIAGEIVTGGKQDRVISKDRIVPPNGDPVDLDVFCVEPNRWVETSARFKAPEYAMAQPSVRRQAMSRKDQQAVWSAVAESRAGISGRLPAVADMLSQSSSYATTFANREVRKSVDAVAIPLEREYGKLAAELRARKAVGAIVAVNGDLVWADLFASSALLEKYWPKLVRSYAAEALSERGWSSTRQLPSVAEAQNFVNRLSSRRENVESVPGVFKMTEVLGDDFDAFVLTSLLPGTGFDVHIAKVQMEGPMKIRPAIIR